VAGTEIEVTADVCLETAQDLVVLLVKAVSSSESASITDVLERRPTAEAQLIGLAVAAFQMNAEVMSLIYGVSTFRSQRIPVILMQGTLPTHFTLFRLLKNSQWLLQRVGRQQARLLCRSLCFH
jgi:hypothetical protein